MDITPAPEFLEACRRVLGADTPDVVIPALRDEWLAEKIQQVHAGILAAKEPHNPAPRPKPDLRLVKKGGAI